MGCRWKHIVKPVKIFFTFQPYQVPGDLTEGTPETSENWLFSYKAKSGMWGVPRSICFSLVFHNSKFHVDDKR